jgi:putative transposase
MTRSVSALPRLVVPLSLQLLRSSMTRKKRHTNAEIAAKLAHADDLAGQGKLQTEIARTLGVSVMTLHRWRKIARIADAPTEVTSPSGPENEEDGRRIAELEQENSRLRRLVTDLLLEKMRLEEATKGQIPGGSR